MLIDDKVVLVDNKEDLFWTDLNFNPDTVGTIVQIEMYPTTARITVRWSNGALTVSPISSLKPYKEEEIPLPNMEFKKQQVKS